MGVEARRYVDFIDIINHVDRRKNSISIGRLLLLFLIRDYYLKKKKIKNQRFHRVNDAKNAATSSQISIFRDKENLQQEKNWKLYCRTREGSCLTGVSRIRQVERGNKFAWNSRNNCTLLVKARLAEIFFEVLSFGDETNEVLQLQFSLSSFQRWSNDKEISRTNFVGYNVLERNGEDSEGK